MTQWMKPCRKRKTCAIGEYCYCGKRHRYSADCCLKIDDDSKGCPACVPEKKGRKK
jgi:hypothetical protein